MSADELKEWLGSEESTGSGWSKDDGSGETIGHERYCPQKSVIHIKHISKYPVSYVQVLRNAQYLTNSVAARSSRS